MKRNVVLARLAVVGVCTVSLLVVSPASFAKQVGGEEGSFVCFVDSKDYDSSAKADFCFSEVSFEDNKYGNLPVVVEGIDLNIIAKSDINLKKFLADEEFVKEVIEAQNYNINLYLDLAKGVNTNGWDVEYSENDPYIIGIKNFVATLENGRITNAEELLAALEVLQIDVPQMEFTFGELEEYFGATISDQR